MPKELITFGSRVTACDCLMVGRVNMVWRVPPTSVLCPLSSALGQPKSAQVSPLKIMPHTIPRLTANLNPAILHF